MSQEELGQKLFTWEMSKADLSGTGNIVTHVGEDPRSVCTVESANVKRK